MKKWGFSVLIASFFLSGIAANLYAYPFYEGNQGDHEIYGTWSAYQNELGLYAVRASSGSALHYAGLYQSEEYWSTVHLQMATGDQNSTISRLEAIAQESVPLPEPATMLLLGVGLISLAGIARKKFRSS